MSASPKVLENQLHDLWQNQNFISPLHTTSDDEVSILDKGIYNGDSSGPDFKNARIRIGNLTYVGDVEIDQDYSDWKKHGHNINNNYNKVILHLSLTNKQHNQYIYTHEGRKVPTVCLKEFLDENFIRSLSKSETEKDLKQYYLKCAYDIDKIDIEIRRKFILRLGIERFKKKGERIFRRLKELKFIRDMHLNEPVVRYELTKEFNEKVFTHEDFKDQYLWKQLMYELVFEALGYSKNKSIMMKLAQGANLDFIRKLGKDSDSKLRIESALYNIAGLIPDLSSFAEKEVSEYSKKLIGEWENIGRIYDGKRFDETQWNYVNQRPQNFPTIRIAGGIKIIDSILYDNFIGTIIKKFTEIRNYKVLINSIRSLFVIKSDGYWKNHYVFDQKSNGEIKYFIGVSRADEIFINVVLPYLSVYFDLFGNEQMSKKVVQVYNIYDQKMDNRIVREVAESMKMTGFNKKTVYTQGMIELFRSYCSRNKCLECDLGKIIFN